jgi:hypothetical protein
VLKILKDAFEIAETKSLTERELHKKQEAVLKDSLLLFL